MSGIQIGRIGCIPDEYLDATGAFDRSALSSCDLFGVPPVIAAARLDMRPDHFISRVLWAWRRAGAWGGHRARHSSTCT